ncbi:myb-related transcription factor, partner of profilin-like [Microcaecilia unicolor]|uniref:Myb-related transcription factor, partner of profilin-like n=1 Tax=Microcaecilia unicolor TaxID=1415580 RepID=A0A6P7ZB64_9AMPH|nr:myb-related transcription factor, partner of profilin-like [Microcaecilia unicolor]
MQDNVSWREEDEETIEGPNVNGRRKRATKFAEEELEVLIRGVCDEFGQLFKKSRLTLGQKNRIWGRIVDEVNALGVRKRTLEQCKHRWQDFRGMVKVKARNKWNHGKGTGGGPPCAVQMTPLEEAVLATLGREQVVGLCTGDDTSENTIDGEHLELSRLSEDTEHGVLLMTPTVGVEDGEDTETVTLDLVGVPTTPPSSSIESPMGPPCRTPAEEWQARRKLWDRQGKWNEGINVLLEKVAERVRHSTTAICAQMQNAEDKTNALLDQNNALLCELCNLTRAQDRCNPQPGAQNNITPSSAHPVWQPVSQYNRAAEHGDDDRTTEYPHVPRLCNSQSLDSAVEHRNMVRRS